MLFENIKNHMYTPLKKKGIFTNCFLPNLANLSAYDSILFSSAVFKTLFFTAARTLRVTFAVLLPPFPVLLENIFPWQGDGIKSQENLNLFLSFLIALAH